MDTQANKENALRLLVQQRRLIAEQIKRLQADLEAIQRAEEILSQNSKETSHASEILQKVTTGYENLTVGEAIIKLMTERPSKSWRPAKLADDLLKEGFRTNSKPKDFLPTVYSSLKRLVEKNEVEKIEPKKGKGRPFYKIKEKPAIAA